MEDDESPKDCKASGNKHCKSFDFIGAEKEYTKGLVLLQNNKDNNDNIGSCDDTNNDNRINSKHQHIKAILLSNPANAKFESGNYSGSIIDSRSSLANLQSLLSLSSDTKQNKL